MSDFDGFGEDPNPKVYTFPPVNATPPKKKGKLFLVAAFLLILLPAGWYVNSHVVAYKRLWAEHQQLKSEHELVWKWMTEPVAQTDDKKPVDRTGLVNFIISDYFKRLEREAREGVPGIPKLEKGGK